MKKVTALILAGGQGKRMGSLCQHRPKPTLPFGGAHRVIDFALSNCMNSQIDSVGVLTDYMHSHLTDYLQGWKKNNIDNNSMTMDILRAKDHYLGTADAVYQNLEYLKNQGAETVIILAADHVYKMDYRRIVNFHEAVRADVTVGVVSMSRDMAQRFGTVTIDGSSKILNFTEKSEAPESNLVSMGIYVFNIQTIIGCLSEDASEPCSVHDFGYSIIPKVVEKDKTFAYRFDGLWLDIGTIEAYFAANLKIAGNQRGYNIGRPWPVLNNQSQPLYPAASYDNIGNSVIGPGCIIKGQVQNSVLSSGVRIDENATVKDSILMNNVTIGKGSTVESCILDDSVNIGRDCYIGLINSDISSQQNIGILRKGTILPPNTAIFHDDECYQGESKAYNAFPAELSEVTA